MSNLIVIDWKDSQIGIDYIPRDWFNIEGSSVLRKHMFYVPSADNIYPALCSLNSHAREVILDYATDACRRFNLQNGAELGVLKIRFKSTVRTKAVAVYWMPLGGTRFKEADVRLSEVAEVEPDDIDLIGINGGEGKARLVQHLMRERNVRLVKEKKRAVLKAKGRLVCEACKFDFSVTYPHLGENFCEVHHRTALGVYSKTRGAVTFLKDLAILCSNCHRMIHRTKPMESVQKFRDRVK